MLQYFEWYLKDDACHWKRLMEDASDLKNMGFDALWLPPAYKGAGGVHDVGYGVYDMYDLGEFDQKGSVPTKYGTKDEYLEAIQICHKNGLQIYGDVVFNHRMGADETEKILAHTVNWDERNLDTSEDHLVEVWTKYTFAKRNKKYSGFEWDWSCFDGTDYDQMTGQNVLLEFKDKNWDRRVSLEKGNFDFIMGSDLDFQNPKVIFELIYWGLWYTQFTNIDGYRLDAIKSIDYYFFEGWLKIMRTFKDENMFAAGEYWSGKLDELCDYLDECGHSMSLFDVPLHFHFYDASRSYDRYDMSKILDGTLSQREPHYSVAFVDNHDTQPHQALESWVEGWFKLHAYSLILLRDCLYPCVFYGDLKGIEKDSIGKVNYLNELVWIRKNLLETGTIHDKFDDRHCIGWMTMGKHPVVVVMTNEKANQKMFVMNGFENKRMIDITREEYSILLDEKGSGNFTCIDGGCSIYIEESDYKTMKEVLK